MKLLAAAAIYLGASLLLYAALAPMSARRAAVVVFCMGLALYAGGLLEEWARDRRDRRAGIRWTR